MGYRQEKVLCGIYVKDLRKGLSEDETRERLIAERLGLTRRQVARIRNALQKLNVGSCANVRQGWGFKGDQTRQTGSPGW